MCLSVSVPVPVCVLCCVCRVCNLCAELSCSSGTCTSLFLRTSSCMAYVHVCVCLSTSVSVSESVYVECAVCVGVLLFVCRVCQGDKCTPTKHLTPPPHHSSRPRGRARCVALRASADAASAA